MGSAYDSLAVYHASGRPLSCEIGVEPWICEFWPLAEVEQRNSADEVSTNAPGYLAFASNGGVELNAIPPSGAVVCMAFVGVPPHQASPIADSWASLVVL